jgi:hypothetical protein
MDLNPLALPHNTNKPKNAPNYTASASSAKKKTTSLLLTGHAPSATTIKHPIKSGT